MKPHGFARNAHKYATVVVAIFLIHTKARISPSELGLSLLIHEVASPASWTTYLTRREARELSLLHKVHRHKTLWTLGDRNDIGCQTTMVTKGRYTKLYIPPLRVLSPLRIEGQISLQMLMFPLAFLCVAVRQGLSIQKGSSASVISWRTEAPRTKVSLTVGM